MNSSEIRAKFFAFFTQQGHAQVPSSPVIPAQDPTLLFTNAGMNQFKDVFLGREKRSYRRAVSIQKCIRAGGKHNDLENVGFTSRHLTFFEMMGNFSFGDYFKEDAIMFAWDFLTTILALDPAKLWASVYEHDDEAYAIWNKKIGLPAERIVRLGLKDNFWQMGDTGPCGPCSEIYIDRREHTTCHSPTCAPGCCDCFLEIWNLVFMQFDRQKDGSDKPLAATGVDTGMGLERLCTVLQNTESVYETDVFEPILQKIEELTGLSYKKASPEHQAAFRVLADHIRSTSFAIADGGVPAADGRGYVLRKIIRRAALFAHKLHTTIFFPQLVDGLIIALGDIYPELKSQRNTIVSILQAECEQFSRNLVRGKTLLEHYIAEHQPASQLSGTLAFTLYDTYGFPLELTKVIAQDHNMTIDEHGFEEEMKRQRTISGSKETTTISIDASLTTQFTGYTELTTTSTIIALLDEQQKTVSAVPAGTKCWIVTAACPFYVESGGQVSDQGSVTVKGCTSSLIALVKQGSAIAFSIVAPTALHYGDTITMEVDRDARLASMKNHTATHLLQAALMHLLGKGVKQSGSLVAPDYLRFDFTYPQSLTTQNILDVEQFVNQAIWRNIPVTTKITTLADAQKHGVIAFFGEKYNPEQVRVVGIEHVSAELCGGTHVAATGEIGLFKIIEVSSPSTGNRRIVAITGPASLAYAQENAHTLKVLSTLCKVPEDVVVESVEKQRAQLKDMQQQLKRVQRQLWNIQIPLWAQKINRVKGLPYGLVFVEEVAMEDARDLAQRLTQQAPGLWILILTEPHHERINFVIALSPEYRKQYHLKGLLAKLTPLGLRGGGSDSAVQGGATHVPETLEDVIKKWIADH